MTRRSSFIGQKLGSQGCGGTFNSDQLLTKWLQVLALICNGLTEQLRNFSIMLSDVWSLTCHSGWSSWMPWRRNRLCNRRPSSPSSWWQRQSKKEFKWEENSFCFFKVETIFCFSAWDLVFLCSGKYFTLNLTFWLHWTPKKAENISWKTF
jgi:hypothetical protein